MKIKKIIMLPVFLSAVLFTFTACNSREQVQNENRQLSIAAIIGHSEIGVYADLNPDIEIDVHLTDFPDGETRDAEYKARLSAQLMAGTAPDVFLLYDDMVREYGLTDYVYDINNFIENAPDFNKEDYYYNVIEAFETGGKLPVWPARIYQVLITALRTDLRDVVDPSYFEQDVLTYEQMLDYYEAIEGKTEQDYYIYNFHSPYETALFAGGVDFNTRTCDFDNPEFITLLERAKNASELQYKRWHGNSMSSWKDSFESRYPFMYGMPLIVNPERYLPAKEEYVYVFDNQVNEPWYEGPTGHYGDFKPLVDNEGKLYINYGAYYAVNANSKNLEEAWKFLKFLTTQEGSEAMIPFANPINLNKEVNQYNLEKNLIYHIKSSMAGENLRESDLDNYELTEEQLQDVYDTVELINSYMEMPMTALLYELPEIDGIIDDFMADRISAEETAKQLQNKISLILME